MENLFGKYIEDRKPSKVKLKKTKFLKPKNFTFEVSETLFGEAVLMVLRNKDKKHIISLTKEHLELIGDTDTQKILNYIQNNYKELL
jgi:hypothetical protein